MFGGNFAPAGYAFCDGRLLSIAEFSALFNLIGTTYGGDGQQTFALPDLRGRIPAHSGTGTTGSLVQGQPGGQETVTLATVQLPAHSHTAKADSNIGGQTNPAGNYWAASADNPYAAYDANNPAPMAGTAVGSVGSSVPHENMVPFTAINFIIALFGVFPSQS
jgi:microcystin-dependent protein